MAQRHVAPYGSWKSPISSDLIVRGTVTLTQIELDGDDTYWLEGRAGEGGRSVLVRYRHGELSDLTPAPFNVRTRVHEYGGGAYTVDGGAVYFSNFSDGRLYRLPDGGEAEPITAEGALRYADIRVDAVRNRLLCVREDHSEPNREAVNTLVAVDLETGSQTVLLSGNDFYTSPRLSPDGTRLCWRTWNHPNMPWNGNELWVGEIADDGSIEQAKRVAGGPEESIFQPAWSPDGTLYFVSDRTGWWNIYRLQGGEIEALTQLEAEFGRPEWAFAMATYGFLSPERLLCIYSREGIDHLAELEIGTARLNPMHLPYTVMSDLRVTETRAVFVAASATETAVIAQLDPETSSVDVLRRSSEVTVDEGYISTPQAIEFPTEDGLTAHALYYPPRNQDFAGPADELPPLIVSSHGGPTGSTTPALKQSQQFWTSRGFAVVDVNYGGSSGYGRGYRERLNGRWGVVDVDDCVNAARYLVDRGLADRRRLVIHGGSAGGYTTLCALTFRDDFRAGASYFGIGDLEPFVTDTHKFESRYMDQLIGPYPEMKDVYRQRSPINFTDQLSCPVILFQGLDDRVVPPNQAELMVEALRKKGLPFAYVAFEGEGHGFRKAENIKREYDGELYFYSRIFGFELPDPVEPVPIENLAVEAGA